MINFSIAHLFRMIPIGMRKRCANTEIVDAVGANTDMAKLVKHVRYIYKLRLLQQFSLRRRRGRLLLRSRYGRR